MNFNRGSEWRRWDLHVHTPESGMANNFKDWDSYVITLFNEAIKNGIAVIGITDYFTIDGYKKLKQEYLSDFTTNWFDYSFDLIYENDSFREMSPGKRAFVILKLLLEFSNKQCPILIDQPEDNMDNRDIYNHLVEYIRTKKTQRQIIIVTHNPNIAVGSDTENIIVANRNGSKTLNTDRIKFQYINGSLENSRKKPSDFNSSKDCILASQGIREHVCEILEGGREAFEKREDRYGFSHSSH